METHQVYQDIENHYKIDEHKDKLVGIAEEWIATEKIHGANFSIYVSEKEGEGEGEREMVIRYGKRNSFLDKNEAFFNYQQVVKKYQESFTKIFHLVKSSVAENVVVQIIGEIFGGVYDHPDVKPHSCKHVQKGVSYIPFVDIMIFDIYYYRESERYRQVMNYDEMMRIVHSTDLRVPPVVCRGSFEEVFQTSEVFQTMIPPIYGLPKISNNFAEGFVFRPVETTRNRFGRIHIYKKKNAKFNERPNPKKKAPNPEEMNKKKMIQHMKETIQTYVNMNRIESAVSKIGEMTSENKKLIVDEIVRDVLKDLTEDVIDTWVKMGVNLGEIKKMINGIVRFTIHQMSNS